MARHAPTLGGYTDVAIVAVLGSVLAHQSLNAAQSFSATWLSVLVASLLVLTLSRLVSRRTTTGSWLPDGILDWSDQVAVVSGGCGGLGSELCKRLLDRGCQRVFALDICETKDDDLRGRKGFEWVRCNLARSDSLDEAISTICQRSTQQPTILIINAATNPLTANQSSPAISSTINVNLTSALTLVQAFASGHTPTPTHTLIVSSIMGVTGVKDMQVYCASKFGLVGLYESLRREKTSNTVSLVLPGHISTALFRHWQYPWPFSYITPTLTPAYVAQRCIEEIHHGRSRRLFLPPLTQVVEFLTLGVVPGWAKELAIWASGSDQAVQQMRMRSQHTPTAVQ